MKAMKTKNMFWAMLSMTAALVMTACSSDNDITETPAAPQAQKTIPYTVTVTDDATTTRATVKDDPTDRQLYFAAGDKLYITGENIQGVLSLQAGDEGKASGATFSGDLTYSGEGSPADNLQLTATLVSAQQTVGTQVSVDAAGAVTVNYPTTAYCADVATAVQEYSRLTGTCEYSQKAFSLTQQTAFLNFVITFEDGTATGTALSAVVNNNSSDICTANVTTTTESEKVVAKFVLPVAAGTTLSSATVTMGDKEAISFGASQTLTGKVYNVKKTQAPAGGPVVGQVIGDDGKYYADAAAATSAGATAVAKIVYVGSDNGEDAPYNHGLALALSDANGGNDCEWGPYNSDAGHTYKPTSSSFSSESGLQYNATHNSDTYPAFKAAIANNGTAAPTGCSSWFLASGYQWKQMIGAAGLSDLGLEEYSRYWSSTERNAKSAFYFNSNTGGWSTFNKDNLYYVRACLAF